MRGGRLGVFCFSQENIIWANLRYRCNGEGSALPGRVGSSSCPSSPPSRLLAVSPQTPSQRTTRLRGCCRPRDGGRDPLLEDGHHHACPDCNKQGTQHLAPRGGRPRGAQRGQNKVCVVECWLLSLLRADGGVGPLRQRWDRDLKPRPADADSLPDWLGPNNPTSSVQPRCGRPQACCCLLPT